ncbi:protein artemis [Dendroctonus ponderosae]
MSTFEGIVEEIPGISIDRFDGINTESAVLFLSHCHTDHMKGLDNERVQSSIIEDNKYLYLTSISATIIKNRYPILANNLKELTIEHANSVPVGDEYISVTCVPAGHCPGSVMFLFETKNACILYTGDYRMAASDFKKFKCFYDDFGLVKRIDKVYLDTTFFLESYQTFPKRQDSLAALCKIISDWTAADPENYVSLDLPAQYGYEYVFKEIYSRCLMPVHVSSDKFEFYSKIPELDKCVTTNPSVTKVHNWTYDGPSGKIRRIKLSALRWTSDNLKKGVIEVDQNYKFYVCYSTHASYQEGAALIEFLKPKNIHICVEQSDPADNLEMMILIDKHIRKIQVKEGKSQFF